MRAERVSRKVVEEIATDLGLRLSYEMRGGYSVYSHVGSSGRHVVHYGGTLREALCFLRGWQHATHEARK